jgi:hypothetical protein
MSTFVYYSILIVGLIMLVRFGWQVLKFAFKAWYTIFALIIVGVFVISVLLPACVNFLLH